MTTLGVLKVLLEGDASGLDKSLGSAMSALNAFSNAASQAMDTLEAAFKAANEGARNQAAEQFFINAGKSIEGYRQATKGLISDADLMKKANLADSMGISEEVFKRLSVVAQAAALKTGQSFEYMFNSIITGTARSSRLLLDNLGIIVSVKQANEKYAVAHKAAGETVEAFVKSMSKEESQIAFANEVMIKSTGTVDEYGKLGETAAAKFDKLTASIENLANTGKGVLADLFSDSLGPMDQFINKLNLAFKGLKDISLLQVVKGSLLSTLGIMSGGLLGAAGGAAAGGAGLFDSATGNGEAAAFGASTKLADSMEALELGLQNTSLKGLSAGAALKLFGNNVAEFERQLNDNDTSYTVDKNAHKWRAGLMQTAADANRAAGNPMAVNGAFVPGVGVAPPPPSKADKSAAKKAADAAEKALLETAKRNAELEMRLIKEEAAYKTAMAEEEYQTAVRTSELEDRLKKEEADYLEAEEKAAKLAHEAQMDAFEKAAKDAKEREDASNASIGSATSSIGGAVAGGSGIVGAIGGVIGPMIGTMVGGPAGAVIGALIPIIGGMIDALAPVIRFAGDLAYGLHLLVQNGLGELLGVLGPLSYAVVALMASLGNLVGAVLKNMVKPLMFLSWIAMLVVDALTAVFIVLGPFVELFMSLSSLLLGLSGIDLSGLGQLSKMFLSAGMAMLTGAIGFVNGMIDAIRLLPGLEDFGKHLKLKNFLPKTDPFEADKPVKDNTDATQANTAAVRDLAREFRNLPQGYKIAGATYSSMRGSNGGNTDAEDARWNAAARLLNNKYGTTVMRYRL